jgi:outer membrane lipoprotein-sorting protein
MKKRVIFSLLGVFTAFVLLVVGAMVFTIISKPKDANDVLSFLKDIKQYKSDVSIEVVNDIQTLLYKGQQTYKKDLGYKLDLGQGRTFIFKGDEVVVIDKENQRDYKVDKTFDEVFKYSFIGEYIGLIYTNEDLNFKKESINEEEFLLIELLIPGSNRNLSKGVLYVSTKDSLPKKLLIYDNKDRERIRVTYENFDCNEKNQIEEF